MANTGFKGIDERQTGTALLFRAFLQSGNMLLGSGGGVSAILYLYELQSDGTFKSFDWNDHTFKTTTLTTETQAMTNRLGNNGATQTGMWTYALTSLSGFTPGAMYYARVNHLYATPNDQMICFQYGSAPGNLATTASGTTGVDYLQVDLLATKGTASAGTPGYVGIDWAAIANQAASGVNLSGTTFALAGALATNLDKTGYALSSAEHAAIATAVFTDTTASDFTAVGSIGKSLFTGGAAPGSAGGLFIAGTNAATTITTALTTTFAGSLTGDVQGKVLGGGSSVLAGIGIQADVKSVVGSTVAATNMQAELLSMFSGVISNDSAPGTTTFTANTSGSPGLSSINGFYSGPSSVIAFWSGSDLPKAAKITGYTYAAGVGTFTIALPGLPTAPAVGDKFIILGLVI
jgi:hypothetical protein